MYRVITPLDGSHIAESALIFSLRLAERFGGTLELVQVIGSTSRNEPPTVDSVAEADRYLDSVAERYAGTVPIQTNVLHGQPVEELLRFFHRADDTIVVMSRHGRTALRRTRFGSVATSLMRGAMVPFLLIDDMHHANLDRFCEILVPLDGSEISTSALAFATKIAGAQGRVCVMRVVPPPDDRTKRMSSPESSYRNSEHMHDIAIASIDEARAFLLRTAQRLRHEGFNINWEVRFGDPATEIVRASETAGAELIVMATHGWGGARHWTFGSVTDAVIRRGTAPVLVVPPGGR